MTLCPLPTKAEIEERLSGMETAMKLALSLLDVIESFKKELAAAQAETASWKKAATVEGIPVSELEMEISIYGKPSEIAKQRDAARNALLPFAVVAERLGIRDMPEHVQASVAGSAWVEAARLAPRLRLVTK